MGAYAPMVLELNSPLRGYLATFISPRPLGLGRTSSRTARTHLFCVRAQHAVRAKKIPPMGYFQGKITPYGGKKYPLWGYAAEKNTPYGGISRTDLRKKYPLWGIFHANLSSSMKKIPPMSGIFIIKSNL